MISKNDNQWHNLVLPGTRQLMTAKAIFHEILGYQTAYSFYVNRYFEICCLHNQVITSFKYPIKLNVHVKHHRVSHAMEGLGNLIRETLS